MDSAFSFIAIIIAKNKGKSELQTMTTLAFSPR